MSYEDKATDVNKQRSTPLPKFCNSKCAFKINHPPCLLVAELLGYHLPQIQPQPISYFLGQVVVGAPAKKHDVRHVRGGNKRVQTAWGKE